MRKKRNDPVKIVLGIAVGLSMSFYAMKKYNKGIF